jgi:hypothetical protein
MWFKTFCFFLVFNIYAGSNSQKGEMGYLKEKFPELYIEELQKNKRIVNGQTSQYLLILELSDVDMLLIESIPGATGFRVFHISLFR